MWLLVQLLLLSSSLVLQFVTFSLIVWAIHEYIRVWRRVVHIVSRVTPILRTMQMDELIDEVLRSSEQMDAADTGSASALREGQAVSGYARSDVTTQKHRERLAALAVGGQAKQYLGKALTTDQIDSLNEDEVEKLYVRYEARLGAAMTKTLGQAALQLYSGVVSMFLPIPPENQPALVRDLEADPFVSHALNSAACELYHRYGIFLAPLTTALTTVKYCQFEPQCPVRRTSVDDGDCCAATTDGRGPCSEAASGKSDGN